MTVQRYGAGAQAKDGPRSAPFEGSAGNSKRTAETVTFPADGFPALLGLSGF